MSQQYLNAFPERDRRRQGALNYCRHFFMAFNTKNLHVNGVIRLNASWSQRGIEEEQREEREGQRETKKELKKSKGRTRSEY